MHAVAGTTFASNEYLMPARGPCPQFWNIIVVREPMQRLVSLLNHLHLRRSTLQSDPSGRIHLPWPDGWNSNFTVDMVLEKLPIQANNYLIRSLLGWRTYYLPLGRISTAHLHKATLVLEQFDVVFIHGDVFAHLNRTLDWSGPESIYDGLSVAKFSASLFNNWGRHGMQRVLAYNALDRQLYIHAKGLYRVDRRIFGHPDFARGSRRRCVGLCGYLCKQATPETDKGQNWSPKDELLNE